MNRNDNDFVNDKYSMSLSVLIALCVIGIFCAISIAVIENVQNNAKLSQSKHVTLPNSKDIPTLVI